MMTMMIIINVNVNIYDKLVCKAFFCCYFLYSFSTIWNLYRLIKIEIRKMTLFFFFFDSLPFCKWFGYDVSLTTDGLLLYKEQFI